jgi:hypothetical protein
MIATFRVNRVFPLRRQSLWVLAGEIQSGEVCRGMQLRVALNCSVQLVEPIYGVEFLDGPGVSSSVALTFRVDDPDDYMIWEMFPEVGEVVEIASLDAHPSGPESSNTRWC